MADCGNYPVLNSCKTLKPEFAPVQRIQISSRNFSIGRGLTNSAVIPFLSVSRTHCTFKMKDDNVWTVDDQSSFGIKVNGHHLGKGVSLTLSDGDIVTLDLTNEFVYKFNIPCNDACEVPRKRMRMVNNDLVDSNFTDTSNDNDIINDMKIKFEASQTHEMEHIEQKLKNIKKIQTTSLILKKHIHEEMKSKIEHLQNNFNVQIENLRGEKNEIERQKCLLLEERDAQLAAIKLQMDEKISELMEQVQKHNETESERLKENSLLKEKLEKERQEFLAELSKENSSKQDMLNNLEAKIKEQEEIRMMERQENLELLHREINKLKDAKEKQIKEIEEQKMKREVELKMELDLVKDNLQEKVVQMEQDKLEAEQRLTEQLESMKRLRDEEKIKIEALMKEREEIELKLAEARTVAAKSLEELSARVSERETELAALAAERIQQEAERSGEQISTLQHQLAQVKNRLHVVETEKNKILENLCEGLERGEGSSKQAALSEVGELVESELQCSICAELFVAPVTLNCSHTFCNYCITKWTRKKMDCPICRSYITTQCKSLVLDTFIERMVATLSEDLKSRRSEMLKRREELESQLSAPVLPTNNRGSVSSEDFEDWEVSNELNELGSEEPDSEESEWAHFQEEEEGEYPGYVVQFASYRGN